MASKTPPQTPAAPPPGQKPDPLLMPSEGGSYERLKDGTLRRIPEHQGTSEAPPQTPPQEN